MIQDGSRKWRACPCKLQCFKKLLKGFLFDKYLCSIYSTAHVTVVTLKMLTHELRTTQGSGWRSCSTERNRMTHSCSCSIEIWTWGLCPSEKAVAPHSSTLARGILWMEEPGGLQSMGSLRVGHDWVISLSLFTFMHWRRKWQPTPVFLPGESQGWGSLWAAVCGVTQSQIWLKWLSSSSSVPRMKVKVKVLVAQSHPTLCNLCTVDHQVPLPMRFSGQK